MVEGIEEILAAGINKSGFPFENKVYNALRKRNWSVLSNRYYLDSDERRPREVDMLAYKSEKHKDYDVRTVLIVSCKKVESKKWVFMTRKDGIDHPNLNWNSIHWISSYPPFSKLSEGGAWNYRFIEQSNSELLKKPDELVFAFQEMELLKDNRARCCGDSSIQSSIMSTVKAQFHELRTQPNNLVGVKPRIYLFNLLTVTNAEIFKMRMGEADPVVKKVDGVSYLSDYIIDQKSTASRVEIMSFEKFDGFLDKYDELHQESVIFYENENENFYKNSLKDSSLGSILYDEFHSYLASKVSMAGYRETKEMISAIRECIPRWSVANNCVYLDIDLNQNQIDILNNNEKIRKATAEVLKHIYRYEGDFKYDVAITF